MRTSEAIKILTDAGYQVSFSKGVYIITLHKLVYNFDRAGVMTLAKDLLFFG